MQITVSSEFLLPQGKIDDDDGESHTRTLSGSYTQTIIQVVTFQYYECCNYVLFAYLQ